MTPDFEWGTEVVRREDGGPPFLVYSRRRHHLLELLHDAARWKGRTVVVQGDRRLSVEKLFGAVAQMANALAERGVGRGDTVLLLAPNSPEWIVTFWAAVAVGAVVVPGNGWWSAEEIAHAVGLVSPAIVVADERRAVLVGDAPPSLSVTEVRSVVEDAPPASDPPAPLAGHEDDPAVIIFTAGTTGLPKGAVLPHRSIIANVHNLLVASKRLPHTLDPTSRGAVHLHTFPLFHIGGIQVMTFSLLTGGTLVFLDGRFDTGEVLDLIESEGVNSWGAVPTMAIRVVDDPTLQSRDLSSLRSLSLGGAPAGPELISRLEAAFPFLERRISANYGMTEAGGSVASAAAKVMAEHPGTSGYPLPVVELCIAEPDEGGAGEILIRTPGQMTGYCSDPESPIDEEGFLHTGDIGRIEDGLLWLVGRSKDVIIRGGENIAAARVESVLGQHPGVTEAAVLPIPHPAWGEEVGAVVVLRAGAAVSVEDLATHAALHLAGFEVPVHWWIRHDPLPVNAVGKPDKRALTAQWREIKSEDPELTR